ncbi:MAG: acetylxylan esterase, partial [Planctomycetaceae bacterium]
VSATVNLAPAALKDAALHYTADAGAWQKREWKSLPAIIEPAGERAVIRATLPADAKLVYYLAVKDSRDATVSTRHSELP